MMRASGGTTRAEPTDRSRLRSKTGTMTSPPGLEPLEDGAKAAHVERVGRALVEAAAARVEDGVVEVEAVHRDEGRLRAEPGDERLGKRRLACAGSTGDRHDNATGRGPRKGPDPREQRFHQAATASRGGSLAPVMKATASDMV